MENLAEWAVSHIAHAHWMIFGAILLAGMNVPISIDAVLILSAFLAAQVVPEKTLLFFFSLFFGCLFSAWISYGIGRFFGPKLMRLEWVKKWIKPERLEKAKRFYERYGFFTLLIGRFIPLGVRNCIFMSAGISKLAFPRFIIRDLFACLIWCSSSFYLFYTIGANYRVLYEMLKTFHLVFLFVLLVTVIGVFWYKKKRRSCIDNSHDGRNDIT